MWYMLNVRPVKSSFGFFSPSTLRGLFIRGGFAARCGVFTLCSLPILATACSVYGPSLLEPDPLGTESSPQEPDDPDPVVTPSGNSSPTTTPTGPATQPTTVNGPQPSASQQPSVVTPAMPPTTGGSSSSPTPAMPPTAVTSGTTPPNTPPSTTDGPTVPDPTTVPTGPDPEPSTTDTPEPSPSDDEPSDDPLVDDFEDGSEQLRLEGSREGFWFSRGNPQDDGTITDIKDAFAELSMTGNDFALHMVAENYTATDTWAVFGANFHADDPAAAYVQAAQYDGLHFWACGGLPSTKIALEVVTTDTSSAYDGEDNHYRIDLALTSSWKEFIVPWDDVKQTWGTKYTFKADHVMGIQFNLATGKEGFDVWLDDLEFIDPAGTKVTAARTGACPQSTPPATGDAGAPAPAPSGTAAPAASTP